MDERKIRALTGFLNDFLLSDIKKIIGHLNDHLTKRISRTHRKQVLIAMICEVVCKQLANNDVRLLDILVQIMNNMRPTPSFERVDNGVELIGTGNVARSHSDARLYSSPSTIGSAPRKSVLPSLHYNVEYKTSPFYTIHSTLSPAKLCTSSINSRASRYFTFEMTPEQLRYFEDRYPEDGRPMYEIRFFCSGYDTQSTSRNKDVEFPAICEIKVNSDHTINGSSVRGLKNKPGTANPADLTSACHLSSRRNTVEFVYAHTAKAYIGSVEIVQRSPVPEIVKKLKTASIISKQETIQRMQERQADTDIVLESETISTKCPLGFCRIQTPARSKYCQHLQCFDATTFLLMNQQTPTWSCPICNRKMKSWDEVGVDEYFLDILAHVSDNVDTIRIEEGGKFKVLDGDDMDEGDDGPLENSDSNKRPLDSGEGSSVDGNHDGDKKMESVTILDDDGDLDNNPIDPDDMPLSKRYKHNPTSTQGSSEPLANSDKNSQVIDLTLDSDDDTDTGNNDDDEQTTNLSSMSTGLFSDNENDEFDNSDKGNNSQMSDEANAQKNSLPNPTTSASTLVPIPTSAEQNESSPELQPTTTTITATTTTALASPSTAPPTESTSPATSMTANSTLSPTTPPKNLIKLPWSSVTRQSSPGGSAIPHLPALDYSQQPTSTTRGNNNIYYPPPNSPGSYTDVNSSSLAPIQTPSTPPAPRPSSFCTPMNQFLHK